MHEVDPKAIAVRVGARIRHLRAVRGLNIRDVAKRTGMHRPIISRVELGTYMPRLDTIYRIAMALDVKMADIIRVIDSEDEDESEVG